MILQLQFFDVKIWTTVGLRSALQLQVVTCQPISAALLQRTTCPWPRISRCYISSLNFSLVHSAVGFSCQICAKEGKSRDSAARVGVGVRVEVEWSEDRFSSSLTSRFTRLTLTRFFRIFLYVFLFLFLMTSFFHHGITIQPDTCFSSRLLLRCPFLIKQFATFPQDFALCHLTSSLTLLDPTPVPRYTPDITQFRTSNGTL